MHIHAQIILHLSEIYDILLWHLMPLNYYDKHHPEHMPRIEVGDAALANVMRRFPQGKIPGISAFASTISPVGTGAGIGLGADVHDDHHLDENNS